MFDYVSYARNLRHELHQYPEIGFDLPKTLAIVRRELDGMGIPYTEQYGKSSIVGTINPGKNFAIALRADMDALPMQEQSKNPYPSQIDGQMHACGHDVHTAQLLAVAHQLKDMEQNLRCTVKLLFTPAEEYITPGCEKMVQDGVTDEFDCAIACHCHPGIPVGQIGLCDGGINANSMGIVAEFFGKSAHAHSQQKGVDAIRMAVQAYTALELMAAREIASGEPIVYNIGAFNGGVTNNVVCDYVKMFISSRSWSDEVTDFMERRTREICENTAAMCGGSAKVTVTKLLPYVKNDHIMVGQLRQTAANLLGEENIIPLARSMGGEDFAFISRKKPSVLFRLGVTNPDDPTDTAYPLHNVRFDADERCFDTGIRVFVNFVLDHQDGIQFLGG